MEFYAVVPAGGSGTRLWPLSRRTSPKFLHPLTGGTRSLLQATVDRVGPLTTSDRTYVVTGAAHAVPVARQLPELSEENILIEPSGRDSAAAIGLAAALIHRRNPTAVMGSFAADHRVTDPEAFRDAVNTAIHLAEEGYLTTIGLTPTRPETGYGYIHQSDPLAGGGYRVSEFTEKPEAEVAQKYVDSGEYLWNASMFVWRVDVVLAEIERQAPQLYEGLMRISEAWGTPQREDVFTRVWEELPKISIDYAVMEGAAQRGKVATVPASIGWTDVGDWDTLGALTPSDERGNAVLTLTQEQERTHTFDASRCVVVPAAGRSVSLLGVEDLAVVDTPDALLIAHRTRAQDVKKIVDSLDAQDPLR